MHAPALSAVHSTPLPPAVKRPAGSRWSWAFLIDIAVFLFVFAAIFGIYAIGRGWLGPPHPQAHISQNPRDLPLYAFYSLVRMGIAYALSLVFALAFGYLAASSRRAEMIMIPLLDILQSIPVLSFLPGVMLAMVAIFPHSQVGIELGSILLIFTGQAWNIAFSFYSSLKTVPRDLHEAALIYRFSRWQRFAELDLPFAAIGLVWNSMVSVAGGWFFLMACEMFVLGNRDFRLPGLGSFLQTAASHVFTLSARRAAESFAAPKQHRLRRGIAYLIIAAVLVGLGCTVFYAVRELSGLHRQDYAALFRSAALTFLRVNSALLLSALWTVPLGVTIGFSPRLARIAQPLVQMAASLPATALFPIILLFLLRLRGGMEFAAMLLMLLGTQWYILFNVVAGAMAIPTDLKEAAQIFHFNSWERWRFLILPGIFPYFVTGMVTASGGAWNASIIAEYFHFQGRIVSAPGLGSTISSASDAGRFDVLLASTLIMATIVVLINRLLWRRLYRLASSRFKLET